MRKRANDGEVGLWMNHATSTYCWGAIELSSVGLVTGLARWFPTKKAANAYGGQQFRSFAVAQKAE